ncbi:MAG: DUF6148 family protein [Fusobacteriaceae bacterium]
MGAGDKIIYEQAIDTLKKYLEAEQAVLDGKSYSMLGKTLTREDLDKIRDGIEYWRKKANEAGEEGTGTNQKTKNIQSFRIIPKND